MKKSILFIIALLTLCLSGCGVDEQVTECLNDVKVGVQNRWEATNSSYNSYSEYASNIEAGIDAELEELNKYKDVQFEDEDFTRIIGNYIAALESQKEGISFIFTDVDKYNNLFVDNGLAIRSACMNELKSNYGFDVAPEFEESFNDLLDCSYTPLVSQNERITVDTEYGEVGVGFIGFDLLTNPDDEKELVLYCEIENISYFDEYNGECLIIDYFIGIYDGSGYNISPKNEAYDYIPGYEEVAGVVDLKQGDKGKFAVIFDYIDDIDIIYAVAAGSDEMVGCYLTSGS